MTTSSVCIISIVTAPVVGLRTHTLTYIQHALIFSLPFSPALIPCSCLRPYPTCACTWQGKQYQLTLELLGATEEEVDDMRMTLDEVGGGVSVCLSFGIRLPTAVASKAPRTPGSLRWRVVVYTCTTCHMNLPSTSKSTPERMSERASEM